MATYVKFETPKEVVERIKEALSGAKSTGKIKKGINETTKSIERKTAKLVVIAEDIQPEEIALHIPELCKEKGIPIAYVPTKAELGSAVGLGVPTSSVAVENGGNANEIIMDIVKRLPSLGETVEVKKEEEKPEEKPKKEEKKEEVKEEKKEEPKQEKPKEELKKEEKKPEEEKEKKKPEEEKGEEPVKEEKKE